MAEMNFSTTREQIAQVIAGGSSSALARALTQPFDVIKIRFQLQVEPVSESLSLMKIKSAIKSSKYQSIMQALNLIYREEGAAALWKGHVPGQVLSIVYGIAQFWTYEQLLVLSKHFVLFQKSPNFQNFLCGAAGGAISTIICAPMDIIKTRLIAQDKQRTRYSKGYNSISHAVKLMIRDEGITSFFKGLQPGLYQIMPFMGFNFMLYNFFRNITAGFIGIENTDDMPSAHLFIIGAITGTISKSVVYPLDLLKRRLQIQGFEKQRTSFGKHTTCISMLSCYRVIIEKEGFLGMFKGMWPTTLKTALLTSINFMAYDKIKLWLLRSI